MRQQDNIVTRALNKEPGAIEELIQQQRQGKHLRLYPEGRKGPTDEGAAPFLLHTAPSGLVRISFGRQPIVELDAYLVGQVILSVMGKTGDLMRRLSTEFRNPVAEIARHATEGLKVVSKLGSEERSIICMFMPIEERDFDLSSRHAVALVEQWMDLICMSLCEDDDLSPWGLTEEQFDQALRFASLAEGDEFDA